MRFPALLGFFLLVFSLQSTAQTRELDSLRREYSKCLDDNCRIHILTFLGDAWYIHSADSALEYTERGLALADRYTGPKDTLYFESLIALLNNSAFLNQKKGNLYKAITLYNRSLNAAEIAQDSVQMTTTLLNLSSLYYEIEEDSTAEKYLSIFMRHLSVTDDGVAMGNALNILGEIALRRNNTELALNHFTSAISYYSKSHNTEKIGRSSMLIGKVYFKLRQTALAKSYYDEGYANLNGSWDKRAFSDCALLLSKWHDNAGNSDSAIYFAKQSYENAVALDYAIGIRDGAEQLANLYEKNNLPQDALKFYHIYLEKSSMLRGQDVVRIGTREQLRADNERKSAIEEIERVKEAEVQLEKDKQQQIITYAGIAVITILVVVIVLIYRGYRNKQKANLEITQQKKVIEIKNNEIKDSIQVAKRIQQALMPTHELWKQFFSEHFVYYLPKDVVSGDFYWSTLTDKYCFIGCCDSTGHGVPGAFLSLLNISFLNEAISEKKIEEPGAILDFVRQRLEERLVDESSKEGMDGILLRFNRDDQKQIAYAAANNKPIVLRNNDMITLQTDKAPVGKHFGAPVPFSTFKFVGEPGDLVVTYTDGFADQFGGPGGKKFKYKALDNLLAEHSHSDCPAIEKQLENTFTSWKGNTEQTDDVLVIGIRI